MKSPGKGDVRYIMFAHLVAAKLNVLVGNDDTPIADTIVAADAWMAANGAPGDKPILRANSPAWRNGGEALKNMLDAYNNGLLGVPSRDA